MFITCTDSYSKYLVVKEIQNKLNIKTKIAEILQQFPLAKTLMMDNEPSFPSTQFKSFAQRCGNNLYFADPRHSTCNGQIERAHSTLTEIARCIKDKLNLVDYSEIIIKQLRNTTRLYIPLPTNDHMIYYTTKSNMILFHSY